MYPISKVSIVRLNDLGCQRRGLDAKKLTDYFKANNFIIEKEPKKADYILFITCAFRQEKEDQCFQLLNKYKNYDGELIVLGCLPGIAPEKLEQEFNGRFLATKDIDKIDEFFKDFKIKFSEIPDANIPNPNLLLKQSPVKAFISEFQFSKDFYHKVVDKVKASNKKQGGRKVRYIRISYGCLGSCSYCSIRYGTGKLKSKPLKDCIDEYKKLINQGFKTFYITGEDTGAYGLDIGTTFPELLKSFIDIDPSLDIDLRIVAFQPKWAVRYNKEITEILKTGKINVITCPVQSGSNVVLKLMNRYYDREEIIKTLNSFKEAYPALKLNTHLIIGFPSETTEDFNQTLNLIKQVDFRLVQLFFYTDRKGTGADKLLNKVSIETKRNRYKEVIKFAKQSNINSKIKIDRKLL